jgi:hypothetical protein
VLAQRDFSSAIRTLGMTILQSREVN